MKGNSCQLARCKEDHNNINCNGSYLSPLAWDKYKLRGAKQLKPTLRHQKSYLSQHSTIQHSQTSAKDAPLNKAHEVATPLVECARTLSGIGMPAFTVTLLDYIYNPVG